MRKVKISYSPDSSLVGTEQEYDDEHAGLLVREGRAVYVDNTDAEPGQASTTDDGSAGADTRPTEKTGARRTAAKTAAKAEPAPDQADVKE